MSADPRLPIDAHLHAIVAAAARDNLVLVAAPGSGKTTRVPPALLDDRAGGPGNIVVLQPRRIAARASAVRVAAMRGAEVGGEIGYEVRFERRVGPRTRLVFATAGVFVRRLLDDPAIEGTSIVVIDEFHERSLDMDLALALCLHAQRAGLRPDLRVVVMSATLEGESLAQHVGGTLMTVEGRAHPVDVRYAPMPDRPLDRQVLRAFSALIDDGVTGHVLVFLPGMAEIRAAQTACAALAGARGIEVVTLHGELSLAEQERALSRATAQRLILATNVAETSLTIEGVSAVIDSGSVRVASHDPWSGIARLRVAATSRASAEQRAGRAGRTGPGRCLRLYSRQEHERREARDLPELLRADLSATVLTLAALGIAEPARLPWPDALPTDAVERSRAVLTRLGALTRGEITPLGRMLATLPVHPRLARLLIDGARGGALVAASRCAAVISEAPRAGRPAPHERSHIDGVCDPLERYRAAGRDRAGGDGFARLERVRTRLASAAERATGGRRVAASPRAPAREDEVTTVCRALLSAFSDRVGKIRGEGDARVVVFAAGGSAELAPSSVLRSAEWCVALEVEERDGRGSARATPRVTSAAAIERDWILDALIDELIETEEITFDETRERVVAQATLRLGALVLDATPTRGEPAAVTASLLRAALPLPPSKLGVDEGRQAQLARRVALLARVGVWTGPTLPDDAWALVVERACTGKRSFAELRTLDWDALFAALIGIPAHLLAEHAPTSLKVHPRGRGLALRYEPDGSVSIAGRIQDFFGCTKTPTIATGRVPVVVHLRAPNDRDVQVTSDLPGFWSRHYPALRRELMRRYPRHDWPEDPLRATPPEPRPPRHPRR